ncbi:MAG: orotidine-5'-phosphate decarboxylase [Chloroflexota bacterium]|nr:orotidine-5'-phosphate decarboxylase [Chloroflexota bacterium]
MGFFDKLRAAIERNDSLLCVGLDPRPEYIPNGDVLAFNRWIIEQTADLVCAYKPNFAFYEAQGLEGLKALQQTISFIQRRTDVPVILDAKRGDIGFTAEAYARAAFGVWGADALTLNPYLGQDSLLPFLEHGEKGGFVLCHTSNPGAEDVQALVVGDRPLYEVIAQRAVEWNIRDNLGLVVGATYPEELAAVRRIAPEMWLLVPGIGAQGGDLEATLSAGLRSDGLGLIINSSRGIIFADDPRQAALALRDQISHLTCACAPCAGKSQTPRSKPSNSRFTIHHSQLVLALHNLGCVQLGHFTLASGQHSSIYIDLRLLVSDPPVLRMVARAYAKVLRDLQFDRLAGIPYAALPIGTAVVLETGHPLVYPRKEVKEHGTGRAIEGKFEPDERVVLLDDVITTGGSKLRAIEKLEAAGLRVQDVVVLLDREQGGKDELAERGYRLHSVLTMRELLDTLQQEGRITQAQVLSCRS